MKRIKVAGIEYTINPVDKLFETYGIYGNIHYSSATINVDNSLSNDRKEQTIIHEFLHAIFFESGYEEQDEEMINSVSITLHQVLRDNNVAITMDEKKISESDIEYLEKVSENIANKLQRNHLKGG